MIQAEFNTQSVSIVFVYISPILLLLLLPLLVVVVYAVVVVVVVAGCCCCTQFPCSFLNFAVGRWPNGNEAPCIAANIEKADTGENCL